MATNSDYIPRTDAEFQTWVNNLVYQVNANPSHYGLTQQQAQDLGTQASGWNTLYSGAVAARDAYHAAIGGKDNNRDAFETNIRHLVRQIQANPAVTPEYKREAGIPVHDTQPSPVPPPAVAPLGECDAGRRFEHHLSFRPVGSRTRGKPGGVTHCEVWRKKGGAPPLDPVECELAGDPQKSPFVATYGAADAGKTVHYMLRFISTRGDPGPWSETVSATVLG
jgi:hypothetical protein